jgi:hypothetical protein
MKFANHVKAWEATERMPKTRKESTPTSTAELLARWATVKQNVLLGRESMEIEDEPKTPKSRTRLDRNEQPKFSSPRCDVEEDLTTPPLGFAANVWASHVEKLKALTFGHSDSDAMVSHAQEVVDKYLHLPQAEGNSVLTQASSPTSCASSLRKSRSSSVIQSREGKTKKLAGDVLSQLRTPKSGHRHSLSSAELSPREPCAEPTPSNTPAGKLRFRGATDESFDARLSVFPGLGKEPCSEPGSPIRKQPGYDNFQLDGPLLPTFGSRKGTAVTEPGEEPSPRKCLGEYTPQRPQFWNREADVQVGVVVPDSPIKGAVKASFGDVNSMLNSMYTANGKVDMRPWAVLEQVLCVQEQILEEEIARLTRRQPTAVIPPQIRA